MVNTSTLVVNVTFKGMDSSDALKEFATKRAEKIVKHMHHLTTANFVFELVHKAPVAHVHVLSGDFEAKAEGKGETMYAAIDEVIDKLVHQTRKYKEKSTNHSGKAHHNEE